MIPRLFQAGMWKTAVARPSRMRRFYGCGAIFSPSKNVRIASLLAPDRQAMAPIPRPDSYPESEPLCPPPQSKRKPDQAESRYSRTPNDPNSPLRCRAEATPPSMYDYTLAS